MDITAENPVLRPARSEGVAKGVRPPTGASGRSRDRTAPTPEQPVVGPEKSGPQGKKVAPREKKGEPASRAGKAPANRGTPAPSAASAMATATPVKRAQVRPGRTSETEPASVGLAAAPVPAALRTGTAGPTATRAAPLAAPAPLAPPAPLPTVGVTGSGVATRVPDASLRPATAPRRARLMMTRIDPWSVLKSAFVLSLAGAIILISAVALLWWMLTITGVFAAVDRTANDLSGGATTTIDVAALVGFGRVMGITLVVCAMEIVLLSVLATLFAFLYNLTVPFTSGIEVTLTEDR